MQLPEIYLKDNNNKIYPEKIVNDGKSIAKIIWILDIEKNNNYDIFIKNEEEVKIKLLDNKNNELIQNGNKLYIFHEKKIIKLSKEKIIVCDRKIFDKVSYEIEKLLYGLKKYKKIFIYRFLKRKEKYYLFNDRLLYGDDNAEVLFKYVNSLNNEISKLSYFVLDKNSERIEELKKVGNVLIYGSIKHKIKYLNSKYIVSSHASYYDNCYNPFNKDEMEIYKDIITKRFIFVPHGIAMNDIRKYINRTKVIADLYTTATTKDDEELRTNGYMYENNQIVNTGLARFDRLNNDNVKKVILISPTWRENLSEKEYNGNDKVKFSDSEYYKRYKSLLTNEILNKKLEEKGYKIKFLLHPVFSEYKKMFENESNNNIKILNIADIRYYKLFNECSMLITDYSSIHFDVAYLKKPIIYYQFDKKEFFEKHYQKGYFEYEKDGFGDVIESEEELVNEIIQYLDNDCKIKSKYEEIIEKTFYRIDKENCKRILEEILKKDNNIKSYRFNDVH